MRTIHRARIFYSLKALQPYYLLVYRTKFWNLHADNSIIGWDILSPDISYNMFHRGNLKTPSVDKGGLKIMRKKSYWRPNVDYYPQQLINRQGICNSNNTNNQDFYQQSGYLQPQQYKQSRLLFNRQGICNSNNTNNRDFQQAGYLQQQQYKQSRLLLTSRVSATATIQTIKTFRQGICNSNDTNNQDFC